MSHNGGKDRRCAGDTVSGTAVPRIHVAAGTIRTVQLPATTVLHGESYKRLAPARKKHKQLVYNQSIRLLTAQLTDRAPGTIESYYRALCKLPPACLTLSVATPCGTVSSHSTGCQGGAAGHPRRLASQRAACGGQRTRMHSRTCPSRRSKEWSMNPAAPPCNCCTPSALPA